MTETIKHNPALASAPTDAEVLEYISIHPELCLQHRKNDGSMDLDGVKEDMEKSRRKHILDNYIGKISKLNGKTDKRYYIRLKDPSKRDGRFTLKAQTKEELLDKIYDWHISHVENGHSRIPKERVTLASLFPEFLEHKQKTTWSISTQAKNMSIWKNHYEGSDIIHVPIRTLRVKHLEEWAYGLIRDHNLTKKEFGNVCTWMKQMLEYAEREEIIDNNPYRLMKITNQNVFRQIDKKSDEEKVLTPEQEMALYQVCLDRYQKRYYPVHQLLPLAIIMLFQTGMRPSEICTLRYEDIEDDEIIIRRYYSDKADMVMEDRTKAGHGPRRIYLTSLAKELIQLAKAHQTELGIDADGYIFITGENFQSFYGRMRKTFPGLCEKANIPTNTPYSGRRTFVSSLIDAGTNIRTIQNYVGHKDSRTTYNNYCFDRSKKAERMKQLENARLSFSIKELTEAGLAGTVPTVPSV